MLIKFFFMLRVGGLKPSITELLHLLDILKHGISEFSIENFYFLARTTMIKDEALYDRFDQIFAAHFSGIERIVNELFSEVPDEWLRKQAELMLTEAERAEIEALGGFEKLIETLKKRFEEQKERHQGGNKWIGTAGTSPFGAHGYNPEGVRIGQAGSRQRTAVKVWDKREFRNLDNSISLGTRGIKIALRQLRKFAREGLADQLDIDSTIASTAKNAGLLDLKMIPEKHNSIKILLCLDVGGSMDDHVKICEELFSAASSEFKNLEYFYFHNFLYEKLWKDNRRRNIEQIPVMDIINKYGSDYKLVFVGDATMSPYEIAYPGGSIEHWNEEAGALWIQRLLGHFTKAIWFNPEPENRWEYTPSIKLTNELMQGKMFPLTLSGLSDGIRELH
ncbi:MAG: VWA domain-containing protein [Woeseiaceae bacterium]|jgi:uncharacterized protein|nr:VWA domain-containing protein [Woeseiaceae bacterium]MDG1016599.1 VWA domain-containing protein [Woeseiaceae bacterium]MDG1713809.1 VWA domain-containing protein [Woeseiaceae bacterium]MDG1865242.1 VWA domain-containing protein [Woeseiaceae bacterium]